MRPDALEQVFVSRKGGRVELRLVMEAVSGARSRSSLLAPTGDPAEAVRWAGRQLALAGEVRDLSRLRLRVERAGALQDDPALRAELLRGFRDAVLETADDADDDA